jgi:hypothetical protein
MQKRAARVITVSRYEIRSRGISERLGWEQIEDIYLIRNAKLRWHLRASKTSSQGYMSEMLKFKHNDMYQLI